MKWKAKQFFSILIAVVLLCTSTLLPFPGTAAATDIPEHSEELLDDNNNRKEDEASSISTTEKTEGKEQQQTGDTQKVKETDPSSGLAEDTDGADDGKQEENGIDNKKPDVADPPGNPLSKTDKKEETTLKKPDKKESGDKPAVKEDEKQDKPETSQNKQAASGSETREQTEKQKIDIMNMKEGETVTFKAMAGSTTKRVSVTRGAHYEYSDYGLGSFETYKYHVSFGNISATAYCVEPSKHSPDSGTYTITKLSDGKNLAKVCYYGTKAAGEDSFFSEKHAGYSEGKKFVLVHLAASYASNGSDAFSGANSTARGLAMELYNWCISQPDIPDVDMEFSEDDVTAYVENGVQRTKEIRFKADKMQSITFHLPKGVKLHNISTGKVSQAGADVEIPGGTSFYLSAPLTQAADVSATFSSTMR